MTGLRGARPRSWGISRIWLIACLLLEKDLGEPRSLGEWGDFLTRVLDDFFSSDEETERDLLFFRRILRQFGERQELSGFDEKINLEVIRSLLKSTLENEGFGTGFFNRRVDLLRHAAHAQHPL